MTYQVLLFYQYTDISDPETFASEHLAYCQELGLKGRILIAKEGINGTVSGSIEQCETYMTNLKSDPRFKDIVFKIETTDKHAFKKMHVRPRKEIVNLSLDNDIDPRNTTGNYLSPTEFYQQMQDENTVIIDARNDYETAIGHFKNALIPDIRNFRDLPQWISENKDILENKKILTYCTGGIRCEKFSGWLREEGYEDVNQLQGGIISYGQHEEVKGQDWLGQMYVFDERIMVEVNQHEHVIVGRDYYDNTPQERMFNCSNPDCNRQIIGSTDNQHKHLGACSLTCALSPNNRYIKEHKLDQMRVDELLKEISF